MFLRVTAMTVLVVDITAHPRRDGFGEYATTLLS
jgi:hypothetical protein